MTIWNKEELPDAESKSVAGHKRLKWACQKKFFRTPGACDEMVVNVAPNWVAAVYFCSARVQQRPHITESECADVLFHSCGTFKEKSIIKERRCLAAVPSFCQSA